MTYRECPSPRGNLPKEIREMTVVIQFAFLIFASTPAAVAAAAMMLLLVLEEILRD